MAPYQQTIFVNLPITNLTRSLAFYTHLGFTQNKSFSNENTAMLSLPLTKGANPHESPIKIMVLEHVAYQSFCPKGVDIPDTKTQSGCMLAFSAQSKEEVDEMAKRAGEAGGKTGVREKNEMEKEMENAGSMYGVSFQDPDGNILECVYMRPEDYEGKE